MPQNKEVWGMPFASKAYTDPVTGVVIYDRAVKSDQFADYFSSFIGNGVFPNPSNSFQVLSAGAMSLGVSSGKGWINGYFTHLEEMEYLYVPTPPDTGFRYDRVVIRLNLQDRVFELDIKEGEPDASNPSPPELDRYGEGVLGDYYELGLAVITVKAGVAGITQSDILDTRLNSEVCGIVHGVIEQVDTTDIWYQYYNFWLNQKQDAEAWAEAQKQDFVQYAKDKKQEFFDYAENSKAELDTVVEESYSIIADLKKEGFENIVIWQDTYLYADGWKDNTYPFSEYPVSMYNLTVTPAANCTQEEKEAWDEAQLLSNKDENTLIALGEQPKINIPVYLGTQKVFGGTYQ